MVSCLQLLLQCPVAAFTEESLELFRYHATIAHPRRSTIVMLDPPQEIGHAGTPETIDDRHAWHRKLDMQARFDLGMRRVDRHMQGV